MSNMNKELSGSGIGNIRSVNGTSVSLNSARAGIMQKPVEKASHNPGNTQPPKPADQSVALPYPRGR